MSLTPGPRFKEFPPGSGHVRVPMSSRDGALAGLALYAACRPWALRAQRVAWLAVRLFGARAIPGRAVHWTPVLEETWKELSTRWHDEVGAFDEVAGFERQQRTRAGCAVLLLRRGEPLAFVKLRDGGARVHAVEEQALRAVAAFAPRSFAVPQPLASGQVRGVHYLAIQPLAAGLHRPPANPPIRRVCDEVGAALSSLARPPQARSHWRPMHGDLAPWNLRALGGRLFLIDWEDVGWAPPGTDELYYRAAAAALSGAAVDWDGEEETLEYLLDHTAGEGWRGDGRRDGDMVAAIQHVLRAASARRSAAGRGKPQPQAVAGDAG